MLPILPFVAGLAVGAASLGLIRKAKANPRVNEAVGNAERKIRQAAASGLNTLKQSGAQWRNRLAAKPEEEKTCCTCPEPEQAEAPANEAKAPPRKPRAPKKEAT